MPPADQETTHPGYNRRMKKTPPPVWRLILSPPMSGAMNMALDDAILERVIDGQTPPTLRLYAWDPPCVSLGYAQPSSRISAQRLAHNGWELVRRATGGRSILHTDELTYSITGGDHLDELAGGVLQSYQRLSSGQVRALQRLGVEPELHPEVQISAEQRANPVCFQVPSSYEITCQGRKLLGSAQLRRRSGILQHGTLPLSGDITRICQVLEFENEQAREDAVRGVRAHAATLESLLGKPVSWEQAAQAMMEGFSLALGWRLAQAEPTEAELARAHALAAERYGAESWTFRV